MCLIVATFGSSFVKDDAFGEEVFLKFMELCTGRDQPWSLIKKKNDVELYEQTLDGCQLLKAVCEVLNLIHFFVFLLMLEPRCVEHQSKLEEYYQISQ